MDLLGFQETLQPFGLLWDIDMIDIKFYINPENCGLYQSDINPVIPNKCIQISSKERDDILSCILAGGYITFNKGKYKLNLDQEELDKNSAIYAEKSWRDSELFKADIEIFKLEDEPQSLKDQILLWREYRKLLRDYPSTENFPFGSRPVIKKESN